MSRRDIKLIYAGKKDPSSYYTSSKLESSIISGSRKSLPSLDFTDKMVNSMLYDLIGKPGKSAGKSGLADNNTSSGVASDGSNTSAYTSSQVDPVVSSGSKGKGIGIGLGAGLIRDIIGYAYSQYAAKQAYDRQNEFYDNHLSMQAKVNEYQAAGLNPMGLAGAGVGATSAPSVDSAPMPDGSSAIEVLGQLLNYKLEKERIAIEKEDVASKIEQRTQERIYQEKLNEWFDVNQVVNINKTMADTGLALEKINTEISDQQLKQAGVSREQAEAALKLEQAISAEIHNRYADAWERNTLALQKAETYAANSRGALNMESINNLIQERQNMVYDALYTVAQTGIAEQQAKNLGIEGEMLQYRKDHQKGDLVFERINSVTSSLKDIGIAAGGIASAATGTAGLISALQPRRPIGFRP